MRIIVKINGDTYYTKHDNDCNIEDVSERFYSIADKATSLKLNLEDGTILVLNSEATKNAVMIFEE